MQRFQGNILLFIDLIFFILSVGLLTYTSQVESWYAFGIILGICILLLIFGKYIRSKPSKLKLMQQKSKEETIFSRMKKYGIVDIFNMNSKEELDIRNNCNAEIIKNGDEFNLLALTGNSYLDPSALVRYWYDIKTKLDKGSKFRLLIVNPFCESKKIRDRLNNKTARLDSNLKLDRINFLRTEYKNFEVRFTNEIYCSLFFTDKDLVYDPYHLGRITDRLENHFFALHIKKDGSTSEAFSYYILLKNHFDNLWKIAIRWEDFVSRYHDDVAHFIIEAAAQGNKREESGVEAI